MEGKEENINMGFPVEGHDVCPDCGCPDCIGAGAIRELKDIGKIPEEMFANGLSLAFPLYDPRKLQKMASQALVGSTPKVATLKVFLAICKSCKRLYVREVDLTWQEVKIQIQTQPRNPGGQSPFKLPFGKG